MPPKILPDRAIKTYSPEGPKNFIIIAADGGPRLAPTPKLKIRAELTATMSSGGKKS
jgi:hypothetical protein